MHLLAITSFILFFSGAHTIVGYWPFTKWPKGKFSIPSTRSSGCPESSDFAFEYGQRTYDCEDDDPISSTSVGMHLDITIDSEKDVHLSFCTKNVELNDVTLTGGDWPSGKYCFFRAGGTCPDNFEDGWILWQDEKNSNRNEINGMLPDGVYDTYGKTKMFFCCRTDGDPDVMIELPRGRSFALLKYGDNCQKVEGTQFQEEYVLWDNDQRDPATTTHSGVIPETGVTQVGDVQLRFCYYTKIAYCGNPGVPENGAVDTDRYMAGSTLEFSCDEGYRLSGMEEVTCLSTEKWDSEIPSCKEIHNCEEDNGGCDHTCIDLEAGVHRCECHSGYLLEDDGTCTDEDECADPEIAALCGHQCVNERGGYHCACNEGYELNPDDRTCRDIDECGLDPPTCQQNCENTEGSYSCDCYAGFVVGSPPNTCDDIDECQQRHPCEHVCTNLDGSYRCGCIDGFELEADNSTCRNKNPCFDKYNVCEQRCQLVDDDAGYECFCEPGYQLNQDGQTCDDINECIDESLNDCMHNCQNKDNGYTCSCMPGYYLDSDGVTCQDIDECDCGADEGCGGCEQTCVNTQGSYHCQCRTSYVALRPDSSQCVIPYSNQDPCRNSNCINMMYAECLRDGNKTTCICKPGYYLNYNGTNCIKEYCEINPCPDGQICEERQTGRECFPVGDVAHVGDNEDSGGPDTNLLIILITVVVVVLWFAIMTIVVMVIKRRRAKKKGARFINEQQPFPHIHSLPHTLPHMNMNRPSSLLDNPIYHANSLYNTSHSDHEHEYEELDKLGHRMKKFASNSYDQGVNMLDGDEAYSYAVTPGPPPPSHILPPPVPPQIAPEYV